jgi:hypothetical protein
MATTRARAPRTVPTVCRASSKVRGGGALSGIGLGARAVLVNSCLPGELRRCESLPSFNAILSQSSRRMLAPHGTSQSPPLHLERVDR